MPKICRPADLIDKIKLSNKLSVSLDKVMPVSRILIVWAC